MEIRWSACRRMALKLMVWCVVVGISPAAPAATETVDLLIKGGTVVTIDAQKRVIQNGAVAVKGDTIVAVGSVADLVARYKPARVIDAAGGLVMPGLVNTHSHASMTLFRGLSDDVPLKTWLEKYIWPAEAEYVNAQTVYLGAQLAIAEMIRSGTTTFNDMYFFMDEVAKAASEAGVRVMIGETLIGFPTPNLKTWQETVPFVERQVQAWKDHPLVTPAIAAHSPYTCSPELLKAAKELADRHNLKLHIHVSETQYEMDTSLAKKKLSPTAYLHSLGLLDARLIAAHCVVLSPQDIKLLAEARAGIAHNPESNMKLGSGAMPLPELLAVTNRVGLGTDSVASNNDLDMFDEMDTCAKLQKVKRNDPSAIGAKAIVFSATMGGARALGMEQRIGSLEAGKRADMVLIPLDEPHLVPMYDPYSHIVYAVSGSDVDTVIVNGKVLMEKRRLLTMDEAAIMKKMNTFAEKVRGRFINTQ